MRQQPQHSMPWWRVVFSAAQGWIQHRDMSSGAALAYYAAFSMAPVLVIAVSVAGMLFGRDSVEGRVVAQFDGLIGASGASLLQSMIRASYLSPSTGLATLIGVVGMVMGATALFGELASAFNRIFGVEPSYKLPWTSLLMARLKGLALVVGLGFMLMVSLVFSAGLMALGDWLAGWTEGQTVLVGVMQSVVSLALMSTMFAFMLVLMAPVRLDRVTQMVGGVTMAILFELGKAAVGLYLGRGMVGSVFGAAGALAVLLVWLYYVSLVILFGIEITAQVYRRQSLKSAPPQSAPAQGVLHGSNG